ncbi:carbonyl reductase [NADPH] 1-like [Atheta coriaria]|uniref:carbonyl reductase [NADPH] 1-like n=1 Tax=Dalotia coriaria TaxID=877792 RepID=UPI0031F46D7A
MPSDKKLAIVTGSNKGIGYAIVQGLCEKFDGDVMLTSRDEGRGREAVEKLTKLGFKPVFHKLDILTRDSIQSLARFIKENYEGIDILVNNAAIAFKHDATEPFAVQAEQTLETNYFALVKVCQELFPLLKTNARVVNISSSCGHLSKIPSPELKTKFSADSLTVEQLNDLMSQFVDASKEGKNDELGWGKSAYNVSKVGVSALSRVQQRIFENSQPEKNIAVNSVHPGYVDTDMTSHKGPLTIEEGASAPLYLAIGKHNHKGQYVWRDSTVWDWMADGTPAPV